MLIASAAQAQTAYTAAASEFCVYLSWNASTGATGYNVYRDPGTGYVELTASPVSGLNYLDCSVSAETSYTYAVTAVNSNGESTKSAPVTIALPFYDAQGVQTAAKASQTDVLTGSYLVASLTQYRPSQAESLPLDASLTVQFSGSDPVSISTDENLAGSFSIAQAASYVQLQSESFSLSDNAGTSSGELAPPIWLTVTQTAGASVLVWRVSPSLNTTAQRLYRSQQSGQGYQLLATLLPSAETYFDPTVAQGQSYYYVVTAVSGSAESSFSNQAFTVAQSGVAAPRWLIVIASPSGATLVWRHSETVGVTSQTLYRSNAFGGPYTAIATIDPDTQSIQDTTVVTGQTYYYVVAAAVDQIVSPNSNEVRTTIP